MNKLVTDPNRNVVIFPHFHDSEILEIKFNNGDVLIKIKTPQGNKYTVILGGLICMQVDSLWEENVIFEVRIDPIESADSDDIAIACHLNPKSSMYDAKIEQLAKSQSYLLSCTSSIGANILAICLSVEYTVD